MILLSLRSPAGNTRGPMYVESLIRSLHVSPAMKEGIGLVMRTDAGQTELAIECPKKLRSIVADRLQDAYPGMSLTTAETTQSKDAVTWSISLRVTPDLFHIRTTEDFHERETREFADPLTGLLSAIRTGRSGRVQCSARLLIRSASRSRVDHARKVAVHGTRRFPAPKLRTHYLNWVCHPRFAVRLLSRVLLVFSCPPDQHRRDETEKPLEPLFECWLRVDVTAPPNASQIAIKKLYDVAAAYGQFSAEEARFFSSRPRRRTVKRRGRGFLLTPAEIATLWHPPTEAVDGVARLHRPAFRELEPPVWLPSKNRDRNVTTLGRVKYRNQRDQFGILDDDLRRHLLVLGKTGCGKSTFLQNVVRQQMEANRGVILFDPHGQLADEVLDLVPKRRTNDVILFDAGDRVAPIGFNPMVGPNGTDPSLIADGVLTSFKNVFGFDAGSAPRLLHIFRNCLMSLIGTPQASISNVQRLLVDSNFRKTAITQVENVAVREFWLSEFGKWNDRNRTEYIASLQNKLGAFTTNEQLQRILNPAKKGIQLRDVMDRSQIMICNFSKGTVGHDASTLLGSLLLSSLHIAAMSRANIPENDRKDCAIIIDEFHSYLSEGNSTMADALAESRKYRTSYVLSTQMLDQLDQATLSGVLGNCGSVMCMTTGPQDAETMTELLGSNLTPEDLMNLPKYQAYLRMLINGTAKTFSMTTLAPPNYSSQNATKIRKSSRQRYGQIY